MKGPLSRVGGPVLFSVALAIAASTRAFAALDYELVPVLGQTAMQGANLPMSLLTHYLSGTFDYVNLEFIDQATGQSLPQGGIDFVCPDQYPGWNGGCRGTYPNYMTSTNDWQSDWVNFVIGANATPGHHTILIRGTSVNEKVVRTATVDINVMTQAQLTLAQRPFGPAVPIPQRTLWETNMALWGAHWCDQSYTNVFDQSILFYDGPRVYYQIGDYRPEPSWSTVCARWMTDSYTSYITASAGALPAWRVFTKGLAIDVQRTGNLTSQQSILLLAERAPVYPTQLLDTDYTREDAYEFTTHIDALKTLGQTDPFMKDRMAALMGQLDQLFIKKRFRWYQPFMVGIAMETLIRYYTEVDPDPRIPYVIKQTLDQMWAQAWSSAGHGFAYRCYSSSLNSSVPDGCYTPSNPESYPPTGTLTWGMWSPMLNNLTGPAYAWMYLQTGDPTYRDQADTIFADGVLYNIDGISWAGKEFSQNYRWSFDYVKWREQANALAGPAPANPAPPTVSISTPLANATLTGTVLMTAEAHSALSVARVQFKIDGVNAGVAPTATPFETQVNTALFANGTHQLTAIATDNTGQQTTSAAVPITISNTINSSFAQCPTSNIPTGAYQACYYSGSQGIPGCDMYANSCLGNMVQLQTDPAPLNASWPPQTSPAPNVSNSFYGVIWQGNFQFPQSATYRFSLTRNGGVRLYVDNTLIADGWWPPVTLSPAYDVPLSAGLHQVRVEYWIQYTDPGSLGNKPAGAQLSWAVATAPLPTPPVIEWVSPLYGSGFVPGANIPLTVRANAALGAQIKQIDFFSNGAMIGTVAAATGDSQYVWTIMNVAAGTYQLQARATDTNGQTAWSPGSITVNVAGPAPTVNWVAPANGTTVAANSNVTLSAGAAAQASGATIQSVAFYTQNGWIGSATGPDAQGHYSFTMTGAAAGTWTLRAQAVDSNGVSSYSAPITLNVVGANPTISWVAPAANSGFATGSQVSFIVNAAGTWGATIKQVDFDSFWGHLGTVTAPAANGQYVLTVTLPGAGWPKGQLNWLIATATDSNGLTTQSSYIAVWVNDPPTVQWVSPAGGTTVGAGSTIALTASAAASPPSAVAKVDFLIGNTVIGTASVADASGHYAFAWPNVLAGTYQVSAQATDIGGLKSAPTAPVSITVSGALAPVSIVLSPGSMTLGPGQAQKFVATVTGTSDPSVVWTLTPPVGTVTDGLYTAPATVLNAQTVTLTATSHADPTESASAQIQLQASPPPMLPQTLKLSIPDVLPLNATLDVDYNPGSAVTGLQYVWTLAPAPASSSTGRAASSSVGSASVISAPVSSRTSSPMLNLSLWNPTPGRYTISVFATDGTRNSNTDSKTITLVIADFSHITVFPNPWRKDKHSGTPITFSNLPSGVTLRIFTVSGHLIRTLGPASGAISWDLSTTAGDRAGSGLYLYTAVDDQGNQSRGKFAIIH